MPIEDAVKILCVIEIYDSRCYDNIQKHLLLVDKLETIKEMEEYDIAQVIQNIWYSLLNNKISLCVIGKFYLLF